MWCLSCFKPSKTVEHTFEAETDIDLEVSWLGARIQEAQQRSLASQESSRLRQQKEEERVRELEKDEQLARAYQYEERETQMDGNKSSALGEQVKIDEQIAKDLIRKQFEEQVKHDEQVAKDLRNHFSKMETEEDEHVKNDEKLAKELQNAYNNSVSSEQFSKIAEKSLKEKGKGKDFEESSTRASLDDEDEQRVIWESLRDKGKGKAIQR